MNVVKVHKNYFKFLMHLILFGIACTVQWFISAYKRIIIIIQHYFKSLLAIQNNDKQWHNRRAKIPMQFQLYISNLSYYILEIIYIYIFGAMDCYWQNILFI